jgi:RNA polymerase sigma-70 factor (ECF subfamily)
MAGKSSYEDLAQLIDDIRQGDERLIRRLYQKYRAPFIKWAASSYDIPEPEAGNFYQEAFVAFYYNVVDGKLTHLSSSLKTYLFAIGKNLFRSHYKNKRLLTQPLEEEITPYEVDLSIMEQQEHNHQRALVKKLLEQIGEPCKTVLELYYFHRFSMESIAQRMEYKNEGVAKKRKSVCLQQLRKMLSDR